MGISKIRKKAAQKSIFGPLLFLKCPKTHLGQNISHFEHDFYIDWALDKKKSFQETENSLFVGLGKDFFLYVPKRQFKWSILKEKLKKIVSQ